MAPAKLRQKSCRAKRKLGVDDESRKGDFKKRKTTLKNKACQLQTLCDVKVSMVCFGSDGEVVTWPENITEIKAIINEYNRGLLGGKAGAKEKQKLNLSSFYGSGRKKLVEKLNKRKILPGEAEENEAFNKMFSGWEAKLSELSEGALKSFCTNLDSKLQILRKRIVLLQSRENENAIQVDNGDNLEPNMHLKECHQSLWPHLQRQPVDIGSSSFLLANTSVLSDQNRNDNFWENLDDNLLLNIDGYSKPNIYQNECDQSLLPHQLLHVGSSTPNLQHQPVDIGSCSFLLGNNTTVFWGRNCNDNFKENHDENLLLNSGDYPEPNMYQKECDQSLLPHQLLHVRSSTPDLQHQPVDIGSCSFLLGNNTTVFLGRNCNDNFKENHDDNLLLNSGDYPEPNMYQKECDQSLLPLWLLGECYSSNQLLDVGSSTSASVLGANTSMLLGENYSHFFAENMDENLLLNDYFSYAYRGF